MNSTKKSGKKLAGPSKYEFFGSMTSTVIIIIVVIAVAMFFSGIVAQRFFLQASCERPYSFVNGECCLDYDGNNVCDSDEAYKPGPQEGNEEEDTSGGTIEPGCGDGICDSGSENCISCLADCGRCTTEEMEKFEVVSAICNPVISQFVITVKNSYENELFLADVWIRIFGDDTEQELSKNARFYLRSGKETTFSFSSRCEIGSYFDIKITGIEETVGSFEDSGSSYYIQ